MFLFMVFGVILFGIGLVFWGVVIGIVVYFLGRFVELFLGKIYI